MWEVKRVSEREQPCNPIPAAEVAKIKIKLQKPHRTEKDWLYIKQVLYTYDVLAVRSEKKGRKMSAAAGLL